MMPEAVVLDTSVSLRFVLDHEDHQQQIAERLLDSIGSGRTVGHILDLSFYEAINSLCRRRLLSEDIALGRLNDLFALGLEVLRLDRLLAEASVRIAVSTGLSGYDAAHVAAAQGVGAPLVTADEHIAAAVPESAIALGSL
jgi:predicted nucleic acid-binding protein